MSPNIIPKRQKKEKNRPCRNENFDNVSKLLVDTRKIVPRFQKEYIVELMERSIKIPTLE
tara:strand:+ start:747 stop:926 length:180 start_codon:yes stop_codon:yes gene_type:complete